MIKITVRHSQRTTNSTGGGDSNQQQQQQQQQTMTSQYGQRQEPNSVVEIKYRHSMNNMNNSINVNRQSSSKLRGPEVQEHQQVNRDKASQQDHREQQLKHLQPHAKPRSAARPVHHANQSQKARSGPRGSLSSCSSSSPELSGAEEAAEYYQSYMTASANARFYEDDDDDCSMQTASSSSVFEELPLVVEPTDERPKSGGLPAAAPTVRMVPSCGKQQQHQSNSKTATNVRGARANRNKLHARSVSLIVNPNFGLTSTAAVNGESSSSDSDDEQTEYKFTRRNSIAPNRSTTARRPSGEAKWVKIEPQAAGQTATGPQQSAHKSKETTESVARDEKTDSNASREQEQNARLREIGFILRQISDEFSRNRRLTI